MDNSVTQKIDAFFSRFKRTDFKMGSIIIEAGEEPKGIFYLREGYVREFIDSESGSELTIHILEKGSHFPMIWAVNGTKNRHYFQALSDVKMNLASKEESLAFLKDNPDCLYYFLSRVLRGLDGLSRRIEIGSLGNANSKVISILLYLCNHFGKKTPEGVVIDHKFTHQDIASLTGLSRERVSIEIEKLERKGTIKYLNHSIVITDLKSLES